MSKKAKLNEEDKQPVQANQDLCSDGMQTFSFDLLKTIKIEEKENLFISPISIVQALSMLNNGAKNETRNEITEILGFSGLQLDQINKINQNKISKLLTSDKDVEISIANSIWYRQGLKVKKEFLNTNQDFYNAEIVALDFGAQESPKKVNNWVSKKTKEKITKIIDGKFDPMLRMLLINAIYFKGQWQTPFLPDRTRPITFDNRYKCQMMSIRDSYPYFYDKSAQIIDLPYSSGTFSMLVALPEEDSSLKELVQLLDSDMWNYWIDNLKNTEGSLQLPKFELDYSVQLKNILMDMGMATAFIPGDADFRKISDETDLFISDVLHKSYLKVNEEGTEAAAVTVISMETTSIKPAGFIMNVNRPFLCVIHNGSEILFMGLVNSPKI